MFCIGFAKPYDIFNDYGSTLNADALFSAGNEPSATQCATAVHRKTRVRTNRLDRQARNNFASKSPYTEHIV